MRIEAPILRQIALDTSLAPRAFQVWRAAIELLDFEWRELKLLELETQFGIDASTASRGLATLVESGYLCRKESGKGVVALFRVPLSRQRCDEPAPANDAAEVVVTQTPVEHASPRRTRSRMISRGVL